MSKHLIQLASIFFLLYSCKGEPVHPIYGKWKLSHVNDELVIDNPDEIYMEFFEDGSVHNISKDFNLTGKFLISDDTTQITILENGKVMDQYKVKFLSSEELVIEEGKDLVKFKKMEE
jgi:hypothetical protein